MRRGPRTALRCARCRSVGRTKNRTSALSVATPAAATSAKRAKPSTSKTTIVHLDPSPCSIQSRVSTPRELRGLAFGDDGAATSTQNPPSPLAKRAITTLQSPHAMP